MGKVTTIEGDRLTPEELARITAEAEKGDWLVITGPVYSEDDKWEPWWGLAKLALVVLLGLSIGASLNDAGLLN